MSRRKTELARRHQANDATALQAAAVQFSEASKHMLLSLQEQLDALKARVKALEAERDAAQGTR